ncbi:OpgC domain-containing protein [Methylibium sp.]|uniref:OpgC domain-containing protein n=1 Tax=Methylibium sp. TaxID=2067992 RepID=UPI0039C9F34E
MSQRLWELDALRGLMLVLMTVTHLPTRFSDPLGQPFGFVSAAEGFVMLSGVMAGLVYTAKHARDRSRGAGEGSDGLMRGAFLKRALKLYAIQAALLLLLFTGVALLGVVNDQKALLGMIDFYLREPLTAVAASLLLLHNPPLMDILPMYIVFMLVSPLVLLHGLQHGWRAILGASVALWLGAQFGLTRAIHEAVVAATGLPVPFEQVGSFDLLAWQFLWLMGLWLGSQQSAKDAPPITFPPWAVRVAIVVGAMGFVWRHAVGQTPFGDDAGLNMLFDKWRLGPLRVIDFFALMLLAIHFAPWLTRRLPRLRALETLGAASLPVFVAHLVLAMLLLAWNGDTRDQRPWAVDTALLAACFAALYGVAWVSGWLDRRTAALRERGRERWRQRSQPLSDPGPGVRARASSRSAASAADPRSPGPPPRPAPPARSDALR